MIDFDKLLELRVMIARYGEMDRARWWNTEGVLGHTGSFALQRGLPRTHHFAQARIAFAVAGARCQELYDPSDAVTLWRLPADLEDQFGRSWPGWLARQEDWTEVFESAATAQGGDLRGELLAAGLISEDAAKDTRGVEPIAEGRAIRLPDVKALDDDVIAQLAASFANGEPGRPLVPHVKVLA